MIQKIVVVEPFYGGSHKQWTDGVISLFQDLGHEVTLLSLPSRHWKWRMYGAANFLAEKFLELNLEPDVLIASDMIDLPAFVGIARKQLQNAKINVYFHENQLTYPWSPTDEDVRLHRDQSYGMINLRTALIADEVFFNSEYHRDSFISAIKDFIDQFPDAVNKEWGRIVENKSSVLYLGMDLSELLRYDKGEDSILLWNHRWEYDKNPEGFYSALVKLRDENVKFKLIICGEKNRKYPEVFDDLKETFEREIIHFGYVEDKSGYDDLLEMATILPVTCNQDFFGGSVVEAIAAGCIPILPNRLAYPEQIDKNLKECYILNDESDWYEKLRDVIQNLKKHQENILVLRKHVERYNWFKIKADYSRMLK